MGSNAAVSVMKDLIIKRYVDQGTVNNWVTAFALIPRPNQDTIRAVSPLLEFQSQIPDAQFILSYSAMIHAFCSTHELRCSNLDQVTRFLSYLEQKIEKGCAPRTHSPSDIKGVRNSVLQLEEARDGNFSLKLFSITFYRPSRL